MKEKLMILMLNTKVNTLDNYVLNNKIMVLIFNASKLDRMRISNGILIRYFAFQIPVYML